MTINMNVIFLLAATLSSYHTVTSQCLGPTNCQCQIVYYNRIKTIMSALDCSRQNYSLIPHTGFRTYDKLYSINFANNRISSVHRASFPKVAFLKRIDLSGNPISSVHYDAFKFVRSTLLELDMSNTGFDMYVKPWFLKDLRKLRTLILNSNHKLSTIPTNVFLGLNLKSLRVLSLNQCALTSLEVGAFVGLENLKVLYLSHNRLTTLSSSLWDLTSLKTLYLDHNYITYIPDGPLRGMSNLRELKLSHNGLKTGIEICDGAFLGLEDSLEMLIISHSALQYVPIIALNILTKLTKLDISYNKIRQIMNNSFRGYRLKTLDISGNPINNVINLSDGAFKGMHSSLEYLYMESIGIKKLPRRQLKLLKKLRVLDVSDNRLYDQVLTHDDFNSIVSNVYVMRSMDIIDIEHNAFKDGPFSIDLRDNDIHFMTFINNSSDCTFVDIDLRNNLITCDCDTARVLYSGTVRSINGHCQNWNGSSFSSESLRHNLMNECGTVGHVRCPFWGRARSSRLNVTILWCVFFVFMLRIC